MAALRSAFPELSARYVLVPTAADWRKNSIGAIQAFGRLPAAVRDRHQLVLFCRLVDEQRRELVEAAEEAGVADRVMITGFVPDDLLVTLYQTAELVMFATFYEGFGLPVLEARRCGARVICSDSSSLPEVMPDPRRPVRPVRSRGDDGRAVAGAHRRRARGARSTGCRCPTSPGRSPPIAWSGCTARWSTTSNWRSVGERPAGAAAAARAWSRRSRPPTTRTRWRTCASLQAVADDRRRRAGRVRAGLRPTGISGCPCESFHMSALPTGVGGRRRSTRWCTCSATGCRPRSRGSPSSCPATCSVHDDVPSVLDDRDPVALREARHRRRALLWARTPTPR